MECDRCERCMLMIWVALFQVAYDKRKCICVPYFCGTYFSVLCNFVDRDIKTPSAICDLPFIEVL